jgi:hypothetical protein
LEKELQGLSVAPDVVPLVAGDVVLRGVPKSLADRVSQVLLEITPEHWIGRILIEEVDGSVTEYRFSGQKEDVAVADPAAAGVAEAATKVELRLLAPVPEFETRRGVTTSVVLLF